MGWVSYEFACLRDAFRGKLGIADAATAFITYIVSPFGLWSPNPDDWGKAMSWAPSAAFAIILLLLIVIGISRSSYIAHRKLEGQVVSLTAEIESLTRPKFSFEVLEWTEPKQVTGKANRRTFRLRVKNESSVILEGCEVKLVEMTNVEGRPTRHSGTRFKLKGDDPPVNVIVEQVQSFNIHPLDWQDIDLVQYDEAKEDAHIDMCYASRGLASLNEGKRVPKNLCPHTMTVRASARNAMPADISLMFAVDAEGILRLNRV